MLFITTSFVVTLVIIVVNSFPICYLGWVYDIIRFPTPARRFAPTRLQAVGTRCLWLCL